MGSSAKQLSSTSSRGTLLLVEDNTDSREMYGLLLETLAYRVLQAQNAEDALNLARRRPPDLVLTDLGLPKVDGIEFVRRLRNLGTNYERIPVIMLTAFDRNHYYYSAAAAGVTAFLTKPIDFDILEATIKKCMKESICTSRSGPRQPVDRAGYMRNEIIH